MSRRWMIVLAILVSSVVADCWFRGPFFFLPFLFLTMPPALVIAAPLFFLRMPQRLSMIIAAAVAILTSYFFCAPPTTGRLLARHLGVSASNDVRDLRRWNDNWGRDPAYFLRFYASEDTVGHIVKNARLTEVQSRSMIPPPRCLLPVPEWWQSPEIESPRTWQGWEARRQFWVNLYFDPHSGLVYVEVLTT